MGPIPKTLLVSLAPPLFSNSLFSELSFMAILVFRTNTSYQRWDEARKNWGMNINHTRDLVRMANAYYDSTGISPEMRKDDLNHVALCTWAFVRAMKRHLSPEWEDEADFRKEIFEKLPQKQAEMTIAAAHRPNRALQDLSYAIDDLPMHFMRKNEIHRAATIFEDNLGSSERILTSPVPLFYSRHLARFLAVWLLLLPFGAYDSFSSSWNHLELIPAMAIISTMLFGIEEIGTQLEEPFTVLPMQAFCDKIYNWCMEIAKWSPGDNGRPMRPIRAEHAYFTTQSAPVNGGYAAPEPVAQYFVEPPTPQYYPPAPAPAPQVFAPAPGPQFYSPPPPSPPPQYSPPTPAQSLQDLDFAEFLKRQGGQS
jgi:predicted membrane chloride channel (bestrophin family)